MRTLNTVVAAALLSMVMPSQGSSQQRTSWSNYCTVGASRFCADVDLTLAPVPSGTQASVRVRNLQGALGSRPYGLFELGFRNLRTNSTFSSFSFAKGMLSGTATLVTTADSATCAVIDCPSDVWGNAEWDITSSGGRGSAAWTISGSPASDFAVVGCDAPPPFTADGGFYAYGYFQTCGSGFVGYSFLLAGGDWSFDEESTAGFLAVSGDDTEFCSFGKDCAQVTPEPTTVLLLGTGLAGIGSAALRKRRRGRKS